MLRESSVVLITALPRNLFFFAILYVSMTYRPLPRSLTIKPSSIDGLGLFAVKSIRKGVNLGTTHVFNVYHDDSYVRTPLGGFINHSDTPNCIIEDVGDGGCKCLRVLRDIKVGEELTVTYSLYSVI